MKTTNTIHLNNAAELSNQWVPPLRTGKCIWKTDHSDTEVIVHAYEEVGLRMNENKSFSKMTADKKPIYHFDQSAPDFDKFYSYDESFKERFLIWNELIGKYSDCNFHALDIGCGTGIFTFCLAEKNKTVIGLDASTEMLKICHKKLRNISSKNVIFVNCNIKSLKQFIDRKADLIICSSVLEYVEDIDDSLRLIKSSMNKNGLFIFSMPNKQSIYRKYEMFKVKHLGQKAYYTNLNNICTLQEIKYKLNSHGFSVKEHRYYGKTLLLSDIFRRIGISRYSDNLFVIVARLLA